MTFPPMATRAVAAVLERHVVVARGVDLLGPATDVVLRRAA